jgi:hypothetical protein
MLDHWESLKPRGVVFWNYRDMNHVDVECQYIDVQVFQTEPPRLYRSTGMRIAEFSY